jgi:hypothetical protein
MEGSIDPRCEKLRGTHWPAKVAGVFGTRVAENHLGQRSPTAPTGRTYGCKRSDQTIKNSCGTGAVHIWVPAFAGTTRCVFPFSRQAFARVLQFRSRPLKNEGAGKTGCAPHPRSRVQWATEKDAHEQTGSAETLRPSLRNGLTAYAVLSLVTGFLTPSPPGSAGLPET